MPAGEEMQGMDMTVFWQALLAAAPYFALAALYAAFVAAPLLVVLRRRRGR